MTYGIEIYDGNGTQVMGMQDFTYTKIFETTIPAPGGDTSPYNVTVPGYSNANCMVLFTPLAYLTGAQSGTLPSGGAGFVPVYRSPGGEVVSVIRRALGEYYDPGNQRFVQTYGTTAACRMEVFRIFGG